jgi:hypothetical protein
MRLKYAYTAIRLPTSQFDKRTLRILSGYVGMHTAAVSIPFNVRKNP